MNRIAESAIEESAIKPPEKQGYLYGLDIAPDKEMKA